MAAQAAVFAREEDIEASLAMCQHAFDVLIAELESKQEPTPAFSIDGASYPMFVTWDIMNGSRSTLRGCIGTLSPAKLDSIAYYAKRSAFKDRRFKPIEATEVPSLRVSVSLLVKYEKARDAFDWDIDRHGIVIEFSDAMGRNFSATYLPHVAREQGWNHEQALRSLVKKSGYTGKLTMEQLRGLGTTRYQSSKMKMTYAEYLQLRNS